MKPFNAFAALLVGCAVLFIVAAALTLAIAFHSWGGIAVVLIVAVVWCVEATRKTK